MKVSAYVFDAESAMITVHPCKQVSATIIATSPAPQTSVLSNQKLIVLDTRVQFRTHDLPTSWWQTTSCCSLHCTVITPSCQWQQHSRLCWPLNNSLAYIMSFKTLPTALKYPLVKKKLRKTTVTLPLVMSSYNRQMFNRNNVFINNNKLKRGRKKRDHYKQSNPTKQQQRVNTWCVRMIMISRY